jgi:hypothetical protein
LADHMPALPGPWLAGGEDEYVMVRDSVPLPAAPDAPSPAPALSGEATSAGEVPVVSIMVLMRADLLATGIIEVLPLDGSVGGNKATTSDG